MSQIIEQKHYLQILWVCSDKSESQHLELVAADPPILVSTHRWTSTMIGSWRPLQTILKAVDALKGQRKNKLQEKKDFHFVGLQQSWKTGCKVKGARVGLSVSAISERKRLDTFWITANLPFLTASRDCSQNLCLEI